MIKFIDPTFEHLKKLRLRVPFHSVVKLKNAVGFITDRRLTEKLPYLDKKFVELNLFRLFSARLLRRGKRRFGESLFNSVLHKIRMKGISKPVSYVKNVLESLRMSASARMYKKGRRTVYIPYLLRPDAEYPMATRWLVKTAKNSRSEKGLANRLSNEIMETYEKKGHALQKRVDLEKLIQTNLSSFRFIKPRRRPRGRFRK